ncbi:MAG TPA: DEAD/DEAH box helicase [Propionibacteriaceae bacterium]|nr:DEAD/DEAH box helicase [Propionibacteriaceae bacterium]
MPLRAWQAEAIEKYEAEAPNDFLVTATPGAGKTTFGLALAGRLRAARVVDRVIVVAPTDHLRTQWADAAVRTGLILDPNLTNGVGRIRDGAHGYVTTYAQVAARPLLHRIRTEAKRTLVILDEIHHAGDARSWGDAVYEAFDPASRRLCLTGTPFRTNPTERIPFVTYRSAGPGEVISEADYSYGYREALADGVVRPVVFAAYAGTSRWMNSAGEVLAADLGEDSTRALEDAAWRTALNPAGGWVPHVIAAIDDRVSHLRDTGMPDAAGLILASDQEAARAYADIAKKVTGAKPVVILSDDPKASKRISEFEHGQHRLAVCVRMVSEGVDIPRAAVLGFLTSYRTPLFFAQAVGRVVRARSPQETATVFLPAVRPLLRLAAELEEQRDHVVRISGPASDDLDALEPLEDRVDEPLGEGEFTPLAAEAAFGHLLHAGRAITAAVGSPDAEDDDYLGLPGLLTPEQTAALLASRDAELRRRTSGLFEEDAGESAAPSSWREVEALRKDINRLVAQVAARTGRKHSEVHVDVRKEVPGPRTASASIEVLLARRDYLLAQVR